MSVARPLAVITGGGIGDLLFIEPSLNALARRFGTPVSVLAAPYLAEIIEGHPSVGIVLRDDPRASRAAMAALLRLHSFTHAIVFWSDARTAAIVQLAGIPERVGQSRRLHAFRYTTRVPVRTETGDTTSHWTDVQMDYARALGATPRPQDYRIDIVVEPRHEVQAQRLLAEVHSSEPFVVLHAARGLSGPFANLGSARTRRMTRVRWPADEFARIGDELARAFSQPVLLTGAEADKDVIAQIGQAMTRPHAVIAGRTSLKELAAIYQRATVVVALDSGPMHIAAAVGAPTVGIFALRADMPQRWAPLGEHVAIIGNSYPCPGCRKETCKTFDCYRALSPESVVAAARDVVRRALPRRELKAIRSASQ